MPDQLTLKAKIEDCRKGALEAALRGGFAAGYTAAMIEVMLQIDAFVSSNDAATSTGLDLAHRIDQWAEELARTPDVSGVTCRLSSPEEWENSDANADA